MDLIRCRSRQKWSSHFAFFSGGLRRERDYFTVIPGVEELKPNQCPFASLSFHFCFCAFAQASQATLQNKNASLSGWSIDLVLRRERDSNPRTFWVNGFQDRRIRPLCHLSGAKISAANKTAKTKIGLNG
jgi:hypothetical protein